MLSKREISISRVLMLTKLKILIELTQNSDNESKEVEILKTTISN